MFATPVHEDPTLVGIDRDRPAPTVYVRHPCFEDQEPATSRDPTLWIGRAPIDEFGT